MGDAARVSDIELLMCALSPSKIPEAHDMIWPLPPGYILRRCVYTSARLYPHFTPDNEQLVRQAVEFDRRELCDCRSPEDVISLVESKLRGLDDSLRKLVVNREQRFLRTSDLAGLGRYSTCEAGGGI
jgi:hypothetical protein